MQLLALLSWCIVESSLLETKLTQHFYRYHELFYAAEAGLNIAEHHWFLQSKKCVISITDVDQLLDKPLEWWQTETTCAGNFQQFQYYYVAEFLGNDECALVAPDGKATADYFRITLLAIDHAGDEKVFLQSTIVTPHTLPGQCDAVSHSVQPGRQSWKAAV